MVQRIFASLVLSVSLLGAGGALAGACPTHYVDGRLPEIRDPALASATTELCYGVFGVMHSGVTRTPLWSAERLRAANVATARRLSRRNTFHAETRLPRWQRAELADYARSGFDRGHMAPNGNMPNRRTQQESFSLANTVPQDAEHNREVWSRVESAARRMAKREGTLYVITGPAFIGPRRHKAGKVVVPSHLYKAVYSPARGIGGAWFAENKGHARVQVLSIAQLEEKIGINLLPSLTARQKSRMLPLPAIHKARPRTRQARPPAWRWWPFSERR